MRVSIGPLCLAAVVIGVAGAAYGVQTDRWRRSGALDLALGRLPLTPRECGDWRGADTPFEPADMSRAGIQGCVFRSYENVHTRETASALLVCGRGGPISVHTPDVCYAGAGYQQRGHAQPKEVEFGDGRKGTFWVARFDKPGLVPTHLEIYWAWSRDGVTWVAPENPRLSLARSPVLYKLYAVRQYSAGTREEGLDSCQNLLKVMLPGLGAALAHSE